MTIYNHGFDVCFDIETSKEVERITNRELIIALESRIRRLRAEFIDTDTLDNPSSDCFGYMDSYEVE
jgi:hypothetical protein